MVSDIATKLHPQESLPPFVEDIYVYNFLSHKECVYKFLLCTTIGVKVVVANICIILGKPIRTNANIPAC